MHTQKEHRAEMSQPAPTTLYMWCSLCEKVSIRSIRWSGKNPNADRLEARTVAHWPIVIPDNDDPLHLKPNPDSMVSKLEQEQVESSDDEEDLDAAERRRSGGVYKPPMMAAAHYGKLTLNTPSHYQ